MPVGRMVRHVTPPLLQELREKVVYPNDMYGDKQYTPSSTSLGLSPVWRYSANQWMYVYADLKIPIERVPGTPIVLKLVYSGSVEGDRCLWEIRFLVVSEGVDVTGTPGYIWDNPVMPEANRQATSTGMTIEAVKLDGLTTSVDLQLRIARDGAHDLDTNGGYLYLLKLICEYMGYV